MDQVQILPCLQPDDIDSGPFARNVLKEDPPASARAIASEAEKILRQLDGVECTTSATSQPPPPIPAARCLGCETMPCCCLTKHIHLWPTILLNFCFSKTKFTYQMK